MSSSVAEPAGTMKKSYRCQKFQRLWAKLVMRKWLNRSASEPDYGADTEDESENVDVGLENYYSSSDEDVEVSSTRRRESTQSRVCENAEDDMAAAAAAEFICNDAPMKLRRRNSETFRAQYINNKEIRVCVGTWNVGGTSPPSDLDIDDWIEINSPADIYVIGLQEVVPLNAGNILGGEDNRPVAKWEEVIREALNRVRPKHSAVKSYSDPPSPGRFKPFEETHDVIEEEVGYENDSDSGVEIHPIDEEEVEDSELKHDGGVISEVNTLVDLKSGLPVVEINRQFSSQLDRQVYLRSNSFEKRRNHDDSPKTGMKTLNRMLSGQERIGLSWPEPPLNMLGPSCVLDIQPSIKTYKSLQTLKSFKAYNSFKSVAGHNVGISPEVVALASMDLKLLMERKRRPAYVRLVSKKMVGILLTIWVKRSMRKHIQNVRVSTVGVGIMGYIGNKGAVSVSMSINQTFFCFICTHLTAGEREVDQIKRNADVHEIHKRTVFHSVSALGLPKHIYDHERIIWLGDLNYRLNLSYEKTTDLISKKDWSKLLEYDQLVKEYKKGRAFDGWSEGTLQFAPTYKYQANSEEYTGANGKATLRKPAWCDRILSYGKGMRLVHYRRTEHKFSDHRPVTATYMAEVEVFSTRKLQRMLTFTDAEIEDESLVAVVV
ncbi:PREDICTED: type IV inositol polyphosphate 5-phosphatase 3-like [Brassica oleracea var. oleracea]|uniref:Inositol polyphosphate-related phosphatase domain-containing protein n=1 Tax=Brassica oleracea var. oleracea TaxID=109376 RepID=A0A0D3DAF6_BRAOL|nr:PREDICTED: type IV inositol polyphosphate 5-phosphatase 3-like [Brassica oleracea var. oleracea]